MRINHRQAPGFVVHRTDLSKTRNIMSYDYLGRDDGYNNAGFQQRVEDNIGLETGDNALAVAEGERARRLRESGRATLDQAVDRAVYNSVAANVPAFRAIEDGDGNLLGAVRFQTNIRTGFTECHVTEFDDKGDVSAHWIREITRRV